MASTTTMNNWMEDLALTLLPANNDSTDLRKHKDVFIRRVKHHNYGRTDQFSVAEKLAGLEEKFMVLNLDDVAEELYCRRMELSRHHERWIPDVLDLLLHLSHAPVKHNRVEKLQKLRPRSETPPPLKWADVEADDPLDHGDQIWEIPDYGGLSSDDDDMLLSSTKTSPGSLQEKGDGGAALDRMLDNGDGENITCPSELKAAQFWHSSGQVLPVSEKQAVREILFMLSGLPTSMFTWSDPGIQPNPQFRISHLENSASQALMNAAASLGSVLGRVRQWVDTPQDVDVMQLIQDRIKDVLAACDRVLSEMQHDILHETSSTGTISLLQVLHTVRKQSISVMAIDAVTQHLPQNDPVTSLNTLYNAMDKAYSACDSVTCDTLLSIFIPAMRLYVKPIDIWLHGGRPASSVPFIIKESKGARNGATLWHDWYALSSEKEIRIPCFLRPFAEGIFTAGKTAAFLQHLGQPSVDHSAVSLGLDQATMEALQMIDGSQVPFSMTFEMILNGHLSSILVRSTAALKDILEGHCGLTRLLDAFDYLYLGIDGFILDNIETRLFDRIDRCMEIWNDRFLVGDLLAEAYQDIHCVDADLITVNSTYTSSRSMANRRRSVKILGAITVSYHVNWPLANIILPASIASYQRIGLVLAQIRRARFVLKGRAYFSVQHTLFASDGIGNEHGRKCAQAIHAMLLHFTSVLYAHLTTCTINPMTRAMRTDLTSSATATSTGTVDDMIAVHARYIRSLEHACLVSSRIKPLHESLLAILDLCIRFTDLVTSPGTASTGPEGSGTGSGNTGFEASSFISARSRCRRRPRPRRKADDTESSSDDDIDQNGGEPATDDGYSTFIMDEDSSVMQEIMKVRETFLKHASFLIAGLRGVARNSGSVGDGFELLADSLEGSVTERA